MSTKIRDDVLSLMVEKNKIENDIQELMAVLKKHGLGLEEPLVDSEGFPLSTVDVFTARNVRQRIICLQNDHKAIMQEIEKGLEKYHCSATDIMTGTSSENSTKEREKQPLIIHKKPFAKIDNVVQGSPAEFSGIQANDLLVEFGSINSTNFKSIADIGEVVQHSENLKINVKVFRGDVYYSLTLTPKRWNGNGLVGCVVKNL